jgi:acetyl esterase/lipase
MEKKNRVVCYLNSATPNDRCGASFPGPQAAEVRPCEKCITRFRLHPPSTQGRSAGTAQLIRAAGVLAADNSRRIMLYLHGGAFLTGGPNTHGRLVSMRSKYADTRFCWSTTGQCPSTRSVTQSMIATTLPMAA